MTTDIRDADDMIRRPILIIREYGKEIYKVVPFTPHEIKAANTDLKYHMMRKAFEEVYEEWDKVMG